MNLSRKALALYTVLIGLGLCLWKVHADHVEAPGVSDEAVTLLASAISSDAGTGMEQYMNYSEHLAQTLVQFPAEKQMQILGFVLPSGGDGNNGHGNDPGGIDLSNPGGGNGN